MSALDDEDLTTWSVASLLSLFGELHADGYAYRRAGLGASAAEARHSADLIAAEIARRTTT